MDLMVLPNIEDEPSKKRARDELPQSASGKTVMTAEPKFVPKEAAQITLADDVKVKVRLVDCVGYMVEGASGHMENGEERKVKTPWFEYDIPFTKAASVGTQKVIRDHATIGIVVTTDGSFGELERENYVAAEEKTIQELKTLGKPFIVLVNSQKPYSQETKRLVDDIKARYDVSAIAINCEQLREEDIHHIMEKVLFEFPVSEVQFYIPKWVEMLPRDHKIKMEILQYIRGVLDDFRQIKDTLNGIETPENSCIEDIRVDNIAMDTGCVRVCVQVNQTYYYEMLSELTGADISGEYELIRILKELSQMKGEYEDVQDAMASVKMKGYGVVNPRKEEISVDEPVIIKQGNNETEIAPIVGSEQQANDLVNYIKNNNDTEAGIWGTNIFGKSIEEMVMDGMRNKLMAINDESQIKLQDTMQKIVNDSNGGMVCIII